MSCDEGKWLPMESAPKDGTIIKTGRRSEFWGGHVFYPLSSRFIDGKWCALFGSGDWAPFDPQPTIWRPILPAPPMKGE